MKKVWTLGQKNANYPYGLVCFSGHMFLVLLKGKPKSTPFAGLDTDAYFSFPLIGVEPGGSELEWFFSFT